MGRRIGWQRAAVAAVVALAAATGVAVVRRDLPQPGPPAPPPVTAAEPAREPSIPATVPPATLPERTGPPRAPDWNSSNTADREEGPPSVHGPLVVDGLALAVGGRPGLDLVGAYDAGTGRPRWRHRTDGVAYLWAASRRVVLRRGTDLQWADPVLAQGVLLVASTPSDPGSAPGHALHALHPATGRVRWELALPESAPGFHGERPLLHRGLVAVPAAGALLAVDPGSGRERWRRPGPGLPRIVGSTGELVLTAFEDRLVALSVRDGQERWRLPLPAGEFRWVGPSGGRITIHDSTLYALTAGLAIALDPTTGAERWRSLTGPAVGPPLRAGGRVYVATTAGLVALEAASGRIAWVGSRRRLAGGPVAAGGRVLVTTRAGDLLGYVP